MFISVVFTQLITSNPKSFSPAATLDPRPRLCTRDRDFEPATATLDPRPRLWTRDPRPATFSQTPLAWGVRGLKILEHLMTFRSSISTGKPEKLLSSMCFFFSVSWSRAYGLCGLSLYTSNDLTYRFKKPLDIFWPQIQRKCSKDYLLMILAVNSIFLLNVQVNMKLENNASE